MYGEEIKQFTAAGDFFKKEGVFTKSVPGTRSYFEFWENETKKSLYGLKVGKYYISGYFYFYLNYCPIYKVVYDNSVKLEKGKNVQGSREFDFPDFWDSDYDYFEYLNDAEKNGEHGCVVKCRGRGYSFKGGSMLNRNYFLIRGSKNYVYAESEQFLTKDGILNKAWDIMAFIDENTAWTKRRQYKNTDLHKKASYEKRYNGKIIEAGYKSEIIGVIVDNPNKVRGKRGKLILWEEAGQFKNLLKAWRIALPSMRQGKVTFGLMAGFGTGGSSTDAAFGLETLFTNPAGYEVYGISNKWEEGAEDTKVGFFVPAFKNMEGYIDTYGNSDMQGAKEDLILAREKIKTETKTSSALTDAIAEDPFTPSEAFLSSGFNIFPTAELSAWEKALTNSKKHKGFELTGNLLRNEDGQVEFKINDKKPLYDFPIGKSEDKTGTVVIYSMPFKNDDGLIPKHLYYICHDPYAQTGAGQSLGAVYVIRRINSYKKPDDVIVASYVARPSTMDEYNRNLFLLAEYYNAKIGFENDRGDVVAYAKRFKLLKWLYEEFRMDDNKELQSRTTVRHFGMHMTAKRKETGEIYLRDWLLSERSIDENGNKLLNLHTIYDVGLIKELIKYSSKVGNFDRVSAMIVGMFFDRELTNITIQNIKEQINDNSFFNRNYKPPINDNFSKQNTKSDNFFIS